MAKRIHANGKASVQARYNITGGCDTEKNFIQAENDILDKINTCNLEKQVEFR